MKRGPPPQPTALKILRGNPGRRPLNEHEPQPASGFPPCPDHLQGTAREAWERFGRELEACGVGTQLDATALEMLATTYAAYLDAAGKVATGGAVWLKKAEPGEIPGYTFSPFWSVMNREFKHLRMMLSEFGMTPAARSSVTMDVKKSEGITKRQRA